MYLGRIESSPSLEVVNLVLNKKARGEQVISLAIGEPSFDTPNEIIEEAHRSMLAGEVHYTSSYGTLEVREAIRKKVIRKNEIRSELDNTIFLPTKFAVYAALVAISEEPYDALLPDPGYFYSEPVILSGGTPVRYRLSSDFSLDLDEIKRCVTSKTRVILLNSPSNPTGKVLSRGQLEEVYQFCADRGIHIISDEAYEDLVYEREHFSIGSLEGRPNLVISLFSLSKSYSMTGWRAGYVVGAERIINLVNKFLENTVTSFPTFIQKASAYALNNCDNQILRFKVEYRKRRKLMTDKMKEIHQLEPNAIEGAFYAFPRFTPKMSSIELCKKMLESKGVAVLPGRSFGPSGEKRIRLSFSGSMNEIDLAMDRVKSFFTELSD